MKSWSFQWKTDDLSRLSCKSVILHQNINGKSINFKANQWTFMKSNVCYSNIDQYGSKSMKTIKINMKNFDGPLKTPWFSSPCEWFRFAFQRGFKSFKMTPWSQLPPKVHLRRKVKYWKCHFLSALHFPEIDGSRCETFRLCRVSFKSVSFNWN